MLKTISALAFKLLAAVGLGFVLRKGGKTAQKLKDAEDTLEGVGEKHEIKDQVRRNGPDAARKRMRKRNR